MSLNLIADNLIKGKIYPALARHQAEPYTQAWREFGQHWPYTIPLRLQEYCNQHQVPLTVYSIKEQFPPNTFYPIGLGFFDFSIDYFDLLSPAVRYRLSLGDFKLLFYYHEGDNPFRIKDRLDSLCKHHELSIDCYRFISANTAAKGLKGFVYFNEIELWYWHRNYHIRPNAINSNYKQKDFTCLNRLHKTWRATVMSDLYSYGVLDNSYWSYCESGGIVDEENPIEIDSFPDLRAKTEKFLESAPYFADNLTQTQRNDHSIHESKYFENSYCNIVMETHFDADGSVGTYLTEKTYKPIKHGQMFFIAGPVGSLQTLRALGYRVFDGILDNRYDTTVNNTTRWTMLCTAILQAKKNLPQLFKRALPDIEHNQQLFQASKTQRLNSLIKDINEHY